MTMRISAFLIAFMLVMGLPSLAQSDLLVLKKNNKRIQSFYPGTKIIFSTEMRPYQAIITSIANDSVYLVQYDIRRTPTMAGSVIIDTVAAYHYGVNYRDIRSLSKSRKGFDWSGSGAALFGGGTIITAVGLGTWIFAKPNTRYYTRPEVVIAAAALAGVGYLLMRTGNKEMVLGKKYSLNYIKTK